MDDSKKTYEKYGPWILIVIAVLFLMADFIEKEFNIYSAFYVLLLIIGIVLIIWNYKKR